MATAATRLISVAEFAAFVARPENSDKWFELERGEIVKLPPPKKPHGVVCANIAAILHAYAIASSSGYVTSNDSGYITETDPDSVRGPEVSYWTDSELTSDDSPEYTSTPPAIAVEVLSPDDRMNRVLRKVNEYLNSGVQQVWVLDPATRDIAVHRAGIPPMLFSEHDELIGDPALPGFRSHVHDFFRGLKLTNRQ